MIVLGNQYSKENATNNKTVWLVAKSIRLAIPFYGAIDYIEIHYSSSKGFLWSRSYESEYNNSATHIKSLFHQHHSDVYTTVELFCSGAELNSERKTLFNKVFGVTIQSLTDKFRSKNDTVELEKIY